MYVVFLANCSQLCCASALRCSSEQCVSRDSLKERTKHQEQNGGPQEESEANNLDRCY